MLAYDRLMQLEMETVRHTYTEKDTIFYGLCAGFGSDPVDRDQLRFVLERNLVALPSMAHTLAMRMDWLDDPRNGIDLRRMLHGESALEVFRPLPASGTVIGKGRIVEIVDRGADKGAVLFFERMLSDVEGESIARTTETFLLRGNGGFGGADRPMARLVEAPSRAPDAVSRIPILPQAALMYRLTGDRNLLHADPAVAAKAGFPRPILHGACTYALACRALIETLCDHDPHRLASMHVRLSAPVFPGETLETEVWRETDHRFRFRCSAVERNVVVLNGGWGTLRPSP